MTHPISIDIRRLTPAAGIFFLLIGAFLSWNRPADVDRGRFTLRHAGDVVGLPAENAAKGAADSPEFLRLDSPSGEESLLDLAARYLTGVQRIIGGRGRLDFYEKVVQDGFARLGGMTPETFEAVSASGETTADLFARLDDGASNDVAAAVAFIRDLSGNAEPPSAHRAPNLWRRSAEAAQRPSEFYLTIERDASFFALSDANPLNQMAVLSSSQLLPSRNNKMIGRSVIEPTCSITGFFLLFAALGLSFWGTDPLPFLFGDGAEIVRRYFFALNCPFFVRGAPFVQQGSERRFAVCPFPLSSGDAFLLIRPTVLLRN